MSCVYDLAHDPPRTVNCRIVCGIWHYAQIRQETRLSHISVDMQRTVSTSILMRQCAVCAVDFHFVYFWLFGFGEFLEEWGAQMLFLVILGEISWGIMSCILMSNSTNHYNFVGFFFPSTMTPSSTPASRWEASRWSGRKASSPENRLVF